MKTLASSSIGRVVVLVLDVQQLEQHFETLSLKLVFL
jgi:hypothetical protein